MGIPVNKEKRKIFAGSICIGMLILAGINGFSDKEKTESDASAENVNEAVITEGGTIRFLKERVLSMCAPVFSFSVQEQAAEYDSFYEEALLSEIPFFSYMHEHGGQKLPIQDGATWEYLLASSELPEGDISSRGVSENTVSSGDMLAAGKGTEDAPAMAGAELTPDEAAFQMENENARAALQETSGEMEEPQTAVVEFVPHEKQVNINLEEYTEFSDLFETFYAMDSNTMVGRDELNVDALLEPNVLIDKTAPGPQILIYHTHSQETFVDSVPGDKSTSIVGAGDKLAKLLTENYGYSVLHHTGEYDVGDRDNAYSNSLPALENILAENPSIQVIIDLHRDGVAEDKKLMVDLDGRPTAQFMFFNGLSRTKNTGDIDYLYNPYQANNLALSFQMQLAADEYYPGLARRIYLNGYRYNMHLRPSLLIELGAQTNTVEEIMNAIDPIAHILDLVFSGKNAR